MSACHSGKADDSHLCAVNSNAILKYVWMRLDKVDVLEQKLDQINKTLPTIESEISTMKVNITEVEEG